MIEVFDFKSQEYKTYLNLDCIEDLHNLIEGCVYIVNNPDKVVKAVGALERYLVKLTAWNIFIGGIAGRSKADYEVGFSDSFKTYKSKNKDKKPTVDDCKSYATVNNKDSMKSNEVFNNLHDDMRELCQALRALVRAREMQRGNK